jgi:hypothetical protein
MSWAKYDQIDYEDRLMKYYDYCQDDIENLEKQIKRNKHNKTKQVKDYIENLLIECKIDKTHISQTPECLRENPFEHFGICNSKGEIDSERISRIKDTYYYYHYGKFENSNFDELDEFDKEYKLVFYNSYSDNERFEDLFYVVNGYSAKYWYGNLEIRKVRV